MNNTIVSVTSSALALRVLILAEDGNHYLCSDNGREALVFPATAEGEVIEHSEVAGGKGMCAAAALAHFRTKTVADIARSLDTY